MTMNHYSVFAAQLTSLRGFYLKPLPYLTLGSYPTPTLTLSLVCTPEGANTPPLTLDSHSMMKLMFSLVDVKPCIVLCVYN